MSTVSNFEYIDTIYRSRVTLLDLLEMRGYNVQPFRKFSPAEISIASESFPSLDFTASKISDDTQVCHVRYRKLSRQKIDEQFQDIDDADIKRTEFIIMMMEPLSDIHHITALKHFVARGLRISFFSVPLIVNNPLNHSMVPRHEIVPPENHKDVLEPLFLTSKAKLPHLRFHVDPITRCLGAVPGDIIKITRPSPSAGEYIIHRLVSS